MIAKEQTLLFGGKETVFQCRFKDGIFVSAFDPSTKKAIGFFVTAQNIGIDSFRKIVSELRGKLGSNQPQFKLIGTKNLTESAKGFLDVASMPIASCTVKEGVVNLFFYPGEARIRIAKDGDRFQTTAKIKKRVLIVDDSKTIRSLLTKILNEDPELEVVGAAELPSQVEGLILKTKPDVITMDIHMPEMDGVTLIKKYLPKYPIPTVMISSISKEEGPLVLDALESGAVDYIQKPTLEELPIVAPLIIEKVKVAAREATVRTSASAKVEIFHSTGEIDPNAIFAFGSSTGGTEALKEVLTRLPKNIPPMVIVQHIPPVFSKAFAMRMNELCPFEVKEAEDGDKLEPNKVLIAPGGFQMRVAKTPGGYKVRIEDGQNVSGHKPSVDVLFESVAEHIGANAIGAILTGMGHDGAAGLLKMRNKGARTIGQDEATCVVYGMPREAFKVGAVEKQVPLQQIAGAVMSLACKRKAA